MRRKKGKRSKSGGGAALFDALGESPLTQSLAAKGWPPVQFSVRMQDIATEHIPADPDAAPSLRAIHFMQGIAGIMIGRVPDDSLRRQLRQQLRMLDDVLSWADTMPFPATPSTGESPAAARAWELLEFAAQLLNYLQPDSEASAPPAVAGQTVEFGVSTDEFKAVVQQGGLAPDDLTAMIPDAATGRVALLLPKAAEICFFLAVAVIGGADETRDAILAVAQRLAEAVDAMRPDEDELAEDDLPRRGGESAPKLSDNWYQLKITLRGVEPPIWRRIVVPDCTLATLDGYVREAMGWSGGHLSCFEIDRVTYSAPHPFTDELLEDTEDGRNYTLGEFLQQGKKELRHSYDFGDGWEHTVAIEKVVPAERAPQRPTCTAGARACPPEDCGGVWGYRELLEALKNPKSPENKERLEWLDRKWDPEAFNAKDVTRALS